jgi:hypothetical protein
VDVINLTTRSLTSCDQTVGRKTNDSVKQATTRRIRIINSKPNVDTWRKWLGGDSTPVSTWVLM